MFKNKPSLNDIFENFAPMSQVQYRTARYAGFTDEALEGKGYAWYALHHAELTCKNRNAPALPKQLEFAANVGYEIPEELRTYKALRHLIIKYLYWEHKDERFIVAHDAYVKDNKARTSRARSDRPSTTQETHPTSTSTATASSITPDAVSISSDDPNEKFQILLSGLKPKH